MDPKWDGVDCCSVFHETASHEKGDVYLNLVRRKVREYQTKKTVCEASLLSLSVRSFGQNTTIHNLHVSVKGPYKARVQNGISAYSTF